MSKKSNEVCKKIVTLLEREIAMAKVRLEIVGRMTWHPRKDGKPRNILENNFFEDERLAEFVKVDCDLSVPVPNVRVYFCQMRCYETKQFNFKHENEIVELSPRNYQLTPVQVNSPKNLLSVLQAELPRLIQEDIKRIERDIKSVKAGTFRKMFTQMVDATNAWRKKYRDFEGQPNLSHIVLHLNSYEYLDRT